MELPSEALPAPGATRRHRSHLRASGRRASCRIPNVSCSSRPVDSGTSTRVRLSIDCQDKVNAHPTGPVQKPSNKSCEVGQALSPALPFHELALNPTVLPDSRDLIPPSLCHDIRNAQPVEPDSTLYSFGADTARRLLSRHQGSVERHPPTASPPLRRPRESIHSTQDSIPRVRARPSPAGTLPERFVKICRGQARDSACPRQ